jgi:zinc protease
VRGMHDRPVTADELRGAKDALVNSLPGAFETSAAAVGNFANTFIYNLGLDYYANYAEEVHAVTQEQALAVTKKYLLPNTMVVVAVGDRKAIEPELQKLNIGAIEIRDPEGRPAK